MPQPLAAAELDAAGITAPGTREAYRACRRLNARHGRTYFLATRLLAAAQRPAIHALYGFARYVDDVVDHPDASGRGRSVAQRLDDLTEQVLAAIQEHQPHQHQPGNPGPRGCRPGSEAAAVLIAVSDTAARYRIPAEYFAAFMRSMRMDTHVNGYRNRAQLAEYVYGSAEVIGLQVLPVLGTVADLQRARPHAAALGRAFQLTNFLRDVAEDLDRGRVYLPADELAEFGVDAERLLWCRRRGSADPPVRRALADQVARTREIYRHAEPGIAMLAPVSRPCVACARTLYSEILDRIEACNYEVFAHRARVPTARRIAVAGPAMWQVARHRRGVGASGVGERRSRGELPRAEVPGAFDQDAGSYDRLVGMNPGYHKGLRRSAERLWAANLGATGARAWASDSPQRVLDLGCGTGASTAALLRRFPHAEIVAADASEQMLARARSKSWPQRVRFVHASAAHLAASGVSGPFDVILAAYLLRNLAEPDAGLTGMLAMLRPGGTLALHEYSVRDSAWASIVWRLVCAAIIIPAGRLYTGDALLYRHLRDSVLGFDGIDALQHRMRAAGFSGVGVAGMSGWQRGVVHTVLGTRPPQAQGEYPRVPGP